MANTQSAFRARPVTMIALCISYLNMAVQSGAFYSGGHMGGACVRAVIIQWLKEKLR